MARRPVTKELYDSLLTAFREEPGNASHAARMAGCDRRMAKRLYELGATRYKSWARPIEAVLAEERASARARAAELERAREAEKDAARERAAKESIEAIAQEQQILRVARADTLGLLAMAAELVPELRALAKRVTAQLASPEGQKIPLPQAMALLGRHATLVERGIRAAEAIVKLGRLDRGEPTAVLGLPDEMGLEEAAAEIADAEAALARARGRGLVALPGGKS